MFHDGGGEVRGCRLSVEGLDNTLPLPTRWIGMETNVADPPREHANRGVVCRGRFGIGPLSLGERGGILVLV